MSFTLYITITLLLFFVGITAAYITMRPMTQIEGLLSTTLVGVVLSALWIITVPTIIFFTAVFLFITHIVEPIMQYIESRNSNETT